MAEHELDETQLVPCKGDDCEEMTGPSHFEGIDDEFSWRYQLCPACSEAARLGGRCESPGCLEIASHETPAGPRCDEHFDGGWTVRIEE